MKKQILTLLLILTSQSSAYNSSDIVSKCKYASNWDGKICLQAIYAVAHDKSRPVNYRYYDAYRLADKFCRRRNYYPEGKKACQLAKYYGAKDERIRRR